MCMCVSFIKLSNLSFSPGFPSLPFIRFADATSKKVFIHFSVVFLGYSAADLLVDISR